MSTRRNDLSVGLLSSQMSRSFTCYNILKRRPPSTLPVVRSGGLSLAKVGGSQVLGEAAHHMQTQCSTTEELDTLQKSRNSWSMFSHLQNENKHVAGMEGALGAEEFTKMKNEQNQKNAT